MNLLPDHQIKQYQLALLENEGPSLAEFSSNHDHNSKVGNNRNQVFQKNKLNVMRYKSMGLSSNANLKGFIYVLLQTIYGPNPNQDILQVLKSTLYGSQNNLKQIRHTPFPELSNTQAKKLLVEFFYSLSYSSQEDKIQSKFSRYPIVIDILTVCLRTILLKRNVKYANNFLFKIPTPQLISTLLQYFDLNCKSSSPLYLFYQENIFLLQSENSQILVGQYSQNDIQGFKHFNTWQNASLPSQQSQFEMYRQIEIERDSTENEHDNYQFRGVKHNQKTGLKIIICQNLDYEPQSQQDAPTPFFNNEVPFLSFNNPDVRTSRVMAPLDSKRHSSFGNPISMNQPIPQAGASQYEIVKHEKVLSEQRQQIVENGRMSFMRSGIQRSQTINSMKRSRSQSSLQKRSKGNVQNQLSSISRHNSKACKIELSYRAEDRQKMYSQYSKSNNLSEGKQSSIKRTVHQISNIYSINIANIAQNHHHSHIDDELQRKKAQSYYSIRSNFSSSSNINVMPSTPTSHPHSPNNKYYNPEQRFSNDNDERLYKQCQEGHPKGLMFRKDKNITPPQLNVGNQNRFKWPEKSNHPYEFKQQKKSAMAFNVLSECPLSPISNEESQFSNTINNKVVNNDNKSKMVSFTYMNSAKSKQFLTNQKKAPLNYKY